MSIYLLALLIGVTAGLRAMTPLAAVSIAASARWLPLGGSWTEFMSYRFSPYVFSLLAIVELITDQLPSTPSRKVPVQFGARIVAGALAGATIGATAGGMAGGLIAGIVGAVIGTYGGAWARGKMAAAFGSDRPAALIEDAVAILLAFFVVWAAATHDPVL